MTTQRLRLRGWWTPLFRPDLFSLEDRNAPGSCISPSWLSLDDLPIPPERPPDEMFLGLTESNEVGSWTEKKIVEPQSASVSFVSRLSYREIRGFPASEVPTLELSNSSPAFVGTVENVKFAISAASPAPMSGPPETQYARVMPPSTAFVANGPETIVGPVQPRTALQTTTERGTSSEPVKLQTPHPAELYSQTEIMAGLQGDSPLAALQSESAVAGLFDLKASRILLTNADGVHLAELKLQPGIDPKTAVAAASAAKGVAWAHVNTIVPNEVARDFTPNDPQYGSQYFHKLAQTNKAWDTQTGSPQIIVAIADDGVAYNHPDLTANIYSNSAEAAGAAGVDDDSNGYVDDFRGWDFSSDDNNPLPRGSDTHGTHVAGIVAARTNNGTGIAGTAGGGPHGDGVRIMPLRWYGSGDWTASVVAETLAYATDNGARIFNSSYNIDGFAGDPTVNAGFNYAYSKGLLIFNSAGNDGALDAPRGVFTQPLFVASVGSSNVRSSFSNYGEFVDVSANGDNILSTLTSNNGTGATYGQQSGTSMSTPHAAGVAALIWSAHPSWTRDQVAAELLGTADSILAKNPTIPDALGSGRVNSYRGVTETLGAPKFTTVSGLPLSGSGPVSSFSIRSARLEPTAVIPANFELRGDGPDGIFDDADDVLISVSINAGDPYRMGVNTLTFAPTAGGPLPPDNYRFTGFSGAAKLHDPFSTPLDGNSDGTGGDNYVLFFNAAPAVGGRVFEDWSGNGLVDVNDPGIEGRTVFLDLNNNGIIDTAPNFTQSNSLAIADVSTQSSTLDVSGLTGTITDLNVGLNITHTWDADLDVRLISPVGTSVSLFSAVGGDGDNFTGTVFDDQATTPIASGAAPFTGRFIPAQALAALNGSNPNGTWTLEVTDTAAGDIGTLLNWSLEVKTPTTPVDPVTTSDGSGYYGFYSIGSGTYVVRAAAPAGWTATSPELVTVTLTPSNGAATANYGTAKNDRYYSNVFFDLNSNGLREPSEVAAPFRVLYDDTNNNKSFEGPVFHTSTNETPLNIADASTQSSTQTITGLFAPITKMRVSVNLLHTFDGDLVLKLIGPDGTTVTLANQRGGSGDNYINTTFDDASSVAIGAGAAPFTGSFRPESPLAAFNDLRPNGDWKLEISDVAAQDSGMLLDWTLQFATGTGPEAGTLTDPLGNAYLDLTPGAHTLRVAPGGGTSFTVPSTGSVTVTAAGAPLTDHRVGLIYGIAPQATALTLPGTQRSRVLSMTVTFSEAVNYVNDGTGLAAFEITVQPPGGGPPVIVTPNVTWNFTKTVATLTCASGAPNYRSLPDGRFTLLVRAATLRDNDGNLLPADKVFSNANQFRLFGDYNGDGSVDGVIDFPAFGSAFNTLAPNSPFDANDDGVVETLDFVEFGNHINVAL